MAGSGRRYAPEFKAWMVELVRAGRSPGPSGKGVRAVRDGDPALGGAGRVGRHHLRFPLRRAPTLCSPGHGWALPRPRRWLCWVPDRSGKRRSRGESRLHGRVPPRSSIWKSRLTGRRSPAPPARLLGRSRVSHRFRDLERGLTSSCTMHLDRVTLHCDMY